MPRPVKCRKVCHFPNVLEFFPADDTEKVSAKYCYVTRKLRLHQNDRCKRFTFFSFDSSLS